MNMIGAPKHVKKALAAGVDIICAQGIPSDLDHTSKRLLISLGGEGGGHTGDVPTSVLIPKVVDLCKGHKSPLTGQPIYVVAAGGITYPPARRRSTDSRTNRYLRRTWTRHGFVFRS